MKSAFALLLALVLFPFSSAEAGGRCGRTCQTLHCSVGWVNSCYAGGCHAAKQSTSYSVKATYDGDDYLKGVMLGIAKKKVSHRQHLEFAAALGLTSNDVNQALGNYHYNTLPQYSQQGLAIIGNSSYSKTTGAYGAAANFGSPENDAILALNLLNRTVDATKEMWNNNIPGLQSIANAHVLGNAEAKRIQAVGHIVTNALIAAKENPSTTTVTHEYKAITQPNGQITLVPSQEATTTSANPPPNYQQPVYPNGNGNQVPNPPAANPPNGGQPVPGVDPNRGALTPNNLGPVPDVIAQKCNICHAEQKKVLIGPSLTPSHRLDAVRRILLPQEAAGHMPQKAATQLTDEEGQVLLKYLTGS